MSLYTAVSLGSSTANSAWNRFIMFSMTFPPKPVGLRVFSKNDILPACRKRCAHPLAPSARVTPHSVGRCREATEGPGPEGLRPQAVGERTVRLPEIFRAMARFSPSAPSGHLPRRGAFRYMVSPSMRISTGTFCSLISPPPIFHFQENVNLRKIHEVDYAEKDCNNCCSLFGETSGFAVWPMPFPQITSNSSVLAGRPFALTVTVIFPGASPPRTTANALP